MNETHNPRPGFHSLPSNQLFSLSWEPELWVAEMVVVQSWMGPVCRLFDLWHCGLCAVDSQLTGKPPRREIYHTMCPLMERGRTKQLLKLRTGFGLYRVLISVPISLVMTLSLPVKSLKLATFPWTSVSIFLYCATNDPHWNRNKKLIVLYQELSSIYTLLPAT